MKILLLILTIFICTNLSGQSKKFKYTYEFTIEHEIKESTLTVDTLLTYHETGIELFVSDLYDTLVPYADFKIQVNDSVYKSETDYFGFAKLELPPEKGIITVSFVGLRTFSFEFQSIENKTIVYKIGLDEIEQLPTIYVICSKRRLNKQEIERIRSCYIENKNGKECQSEEYRIYIQI